MSLRDVIERWKPIAAREHWDNMKLEIAPFMEEAKRNGATVDEIITAKERIINIWSAPTWKAAQEEHPGWSQKKWYETQRSYVVSGVGSAIRTVFAEEISASKKQPAPSQKVEQKPQPKPEVKAESVATQPTVSAKARLRLIAQSFLTDQEKETFVFLEDGAAARKDTQEYLERIKKEHSQ